jgi:hypothetical protein
MKQPTERDKQVKVGASNYSSLCSRCVAQDLAATTNSGGFSPYWLGAWMGTAMHNRLDEETQAHRPDWVPEQKLVMGDLAGYGTIKSTTDLYVPGLKLVTDYKSTTKAKIKYIKDALRDEPSDYDATAIKEARMKVGGYLNQVQSYGRGVVASGGEVEWVSLLFVCRDGTGDNDIWAHTVPYDQQRADEVWNRVEKLWAWLNEGHSPEELKSHPYCYACNHRND